MKLIASHYSQCDTIIWNAPADDITYVDMPDSRGLLYKQTFVMGRIVDVKNALAGIKVRGDIDLSIKVLDDILPWNNGVFRLKCMNERVEVSSAEGFPQVVVSINTLAQLLWGYITPEQAVRHGKLECSDSNAMCTLKEVFSPAVPYIIEDY